VSGAVPAWEQHVSRSRRWVGDHVGDVIGHAAWLVAVGVVIDALLQALPATISLAVSGLEAVGAVAAGVVGLGLWWTANCALHEAAHAVALRSRGVVADVTLQPVTAFGQPLPVASGGTVRPRGDGYARLTPDDHIRVALAPAWIAAVGSVVVAAVATVAGASALLTASLVAGTWLFGGPSPSDYSRVVDSLLWPDEIRDQRQRQAARIREHAAVEGADPRALAPDRHTTAMSYDTTPTTGASPAKHAVPDGGERT